MSNDVNIQPVGITELVLRDGHQSLFATRLLVPNLVEVAVVDHFLQSCASPLSCVSPLRVQPWHRSLFSPPRFAAIAQRRGRARGRRVEHCAVH